MEIILDEEKCQGHANCVAAAPELFDINEDGIAIVLDSKPPEELHEAARNAARLCPVQAIEIVEP